LRRCGGSLEITHGLEQLLRGADGQAVLFAFDANERSVRNAQNFRESSRRDSILLDKSADFGGELILVKIFNRVS